MENTKALAPGDTVSKTEPASISTMKFRPQALRIVIPVRVGNLRGAGDLVALAAEPVKHVIRRVAPDWDCGGCEKRRETLNRIVQFKG